MSISIFLLFLLYTVGFCNYQRKIKNNNKSKKKKNALPCVAGVLGAEEQGPEETEE